MDDNGAERLKRAAQDALQAGEAEYALSILTPLLEDRRDDAEALVLAGAALLAAGEAEHSLSALDRALTLTPEQPTAHYNRGRALERLGRLEDAARAYSRTLDLVPEHAPAANRLSALLRGDTAGAHPVKRTTSGGSATVSSRHRVIRRGAPSPKQASPSDDLTLRAAEAMAHVVQRLEQLVEKVDDASTHRPGSPAPRTASPQAISEHQAAAAPSERGLVRPEPDPDVWFQRPNLPERPDPSLIPSSYGPEMWPAGFQEESPLPNLWQLCGATLQLFLLKPLPWVLPLIAAHALAALLSLLLPLNPWLEMLAWEAAFVCGVSPALLVLTDQWILGGEAAPVPYLKRLLGVGRIVLLIQILVFAPITAMLAWRTGLPLPLLNTLAIVLSFPIHVLLAPALFVGTTEDAPLGVALRAGVELAPARAKYYLGVMALTLIGGGGLVAGLVYLLSRSFAGAGEGFTLLWWTLGASLGAGLWGAAVIACGGDAVAASELVEDDPSPQPVPF